MIKVKNMTVYYAHLNTNHGASGCITDLDFCNRHLAAPLLAPLKDRIYDISERRTALRE